jgi:hypothetical protein
MFFFLPYPKLFSMPDEADAEQIQVGLIEELE